MPLVPGSLATPFAQYILDSQKGGEVSKPEEAAQALAKKLEELVFAAIRSATVTLAPGTPIVTTAGAGTITGPLTAKLS